MRYNLPGLVEEMANKGDEVNNSALDIEIIEECSLQVYTIHNAIEWSGQSYG